jgi:hypothetical protein
MASSSHIGVADMLAEMEDITLQWRTMAREARRARAGRE